MKRIAVIGLGTFGYNISLLLTKRGAEVIAVDSDMDRIEEIKNDVGVAVCLDANHERSLKAQGIHEVDTAVVCIGENFHANILTTVLLKKLGVEKVYSRVSNAIERQILLEVGATDAVIPEEEMAREMAVQLTSESFLDVIPLSHNMSAARLNVPEPFWGKTLKDSNLRKDYGVNVVAVYNPDKNSKSSNLIPGPDTVLEKDFELLVVGMTEHVDNLSKLT